MDIKLVPQQDYEQIHRLRDYSFPNRYEGERRRDFQYWIEHSTTICAYDKEKIVGQLLVLPLNMTVHGVNYKMGGIGFVATYPEYRNRGIMKKLMVRALEEMQRNGQWISVLAPYSVSFYRYFGWELFFDKLHYTIPVEAFPAFGHQLDHMERFSFAWMNDDVFQDIQQFHTRHSQICNGGMIRDSAWWQRIARREPDSHFAAYYNASNKIAGYIRYTISDLTFYVHDLFADNMEAEHAIWRFITSHSASVKSIKGTSSADCLFGFGFQQPQFKKEITQDCMVRIVDAFAFLKAYSWVEIQNPLYVRLADPFCSWNEGLFQISSDCRVTKIEGNDVNELHVLSLSINLFSAMMVGYLSVEDALRFANTEIAQENLSDWQKALPTSKPQFFEYF
ncbi:GNAT family N-acetyltransferase [Lysinibacillus sp. 54212]|uniref:GNAT family N-acetyltransferase n=1 Tax=Lysinibacillus sp. 54212 TaxID=3119829 RepID=UPI002FC622EE